MGMIQTPLKTMERPQQAKAGTVFLLQKCTGEMSSSVNYFSSTRNSQERKI